MGPGGVPDPSWDNQSSFSENKGLNVRSHTCPWAPQSCKSKGRLKGNWDKVLLSSRWLSSPGIRPSCRGCPWTSQNAQYLQIFSLSLSLSLLFSILFKWVWSKFGHLNSQKPGLRQLAFKANSSSYWVYFLVFWFHIFANWCVNDEAFRDSW